MRCRWLFALAALAVPPSVADAAPVEPVRPAAPAEARAADDISAVLNKDGIEFKSGKDVVAKYATDAKYSKPFLYPVLAPGGTPVTRGWPIEMGLPGEVKKDHVHQKSVWFCHGDVIPEGLELKTKSATKAVKGVNTWDENPGHGQIKVVKVGEPKAGNGAVSVETQNEWLTADGVKFLDETRVITFRQTAEGRLFAFDITLKASACPITFGDTKEGSFGVRVHDSLRPEVATGATVTTAEGASLAPPQKDNMSVWGKPAAWMDYSGKVADKAVGVAVFDHPSNPQASWHSRAYGLHAANPFGREGSGFPSQKGKPDLLKIEKGGELKLKYAVYAHTGDAKSGKVAEVYESFKK